MGENDKADDRKVAAPMESTTRLPEKGEISIHSAQPMASAPTTPPPARPKLK
ncbi:MAG: hypothetical protein K0B00_05420 [Rhodobacteraceae bacterium]|nr:hypothetical protein [Paracoccaceae bacterium]